MRKQLVILLFLLINLCSIEAVQVKVACGDWITFSAAAYEDYHFVQWSDGVKDSIRDVEVTGNRQYIAYFEANCGMLAQFPVVNKYDWLLMLDLNKINDKGYYFSDDKVTWYRVVGEPDDITQDTLRDDMIMGTGYYLTLDQNLKNTGDYYAVVDVSAGADGQLCYERMRTWIVHYDQSEDIDNNTEYKPWLIPNMVGQGQTMQIQGLDPNEYTSLIIYATTGQLVRTITGIKQSYYNLVADQVLGGYLILVQTGNKQATLRYFIVR